MFDFLCEVKCRVAHLSYPPLRKATHLTRQENSLYTALSSVRHSNSNFIYFQEQTVKMSGKLLWWFCPFEWSYFFSLAMSCPGGSIYKSCGTRCPSTCLNISAVDSCSSLPVEGCFCKEGYILSGDKCVPESSCGCIDEKNQYHQASYLWCLKKKKKNEHGNSFFITMREKNINIINTVIIYSINNNKIDSLCQASWSVSCVATSAQIIIHHEHSNANNTIVPYGITFQFIL